MFSVNSISVRKINVNVQSTKKVLITIKHGCFCPVCDQQKVNAIFLYARFCGCVFAKRHEKCTGQVDGQKCTSVLVLTFQTMDSRFQMPLIPCKSITAVTDATRREVGSNKVCRNHTVLYCQCPSLQPVNFVRIHLSNVTERRKRVRTNFYCYHFSVRVLSLVAARFHLFLFFILFLLLLRPRSSE